MGKLEKHWEMLSSIGRDDLSRGREVDEDRRGKNNNERGDMTCGQRRVAISRACEA